MKLEFIHATIQPGYKRVRRIVMAEIIEYPCKSNLECKDCEHFKLCQRIGIHAGEFREFFGKVS